VRKGLARVARFLKSPLPRISFGLVMLTVSLLLIADFLGLMPDTRAQEIELRQHIAESVAVQVSMEIGERDATKLQQILRIAVERNDRVLSVAVKRVNGGMVHSEGAHAVGWTLAPLAQSTAEQMRVALYSPRGQWGNVELVFDAVPISASIFRGGFAVLKIALLVTVAGFIGYFFFLKKVMRELDPDQVLPDRVRSALDSLTDGLMIINHEGVIMFCNLAMTKRIGINSRRLTGKELGSLDWVAVVDGEPLPWKPVLDGSKEAVERAVDLRVGHHQHYKFVANASPIIGDADDIRGVMITFNDTTELEKKNSELSVTLANLEASQAEIEAKNRELFSMATRDPLTNLFNRRAFFEAFDTLFEQAVKNKSRLGCIMLDIDHFKSVNDTFGHGVGDEVIVYLADTLRSFLGDMDVAGRFGGEEFCMLIPDATVEATSQRAEKIRKHIQQGLNADLSVKLSITSSFGVACLPGDAKTPSELIEFADLALYEAKSMGRNRVVSWHGEAGGRLETKNSTGGVSQSVRVGRDAPKGQVAPEQSVALQNKATLEKHAANDVQIEGVDPTVANSDNPAAAPKALHEPGKAFTHRQLLSTTIQTAIKRAQGESHVLALVVLDGTAVRHIANNVGFNVGNELCSVLVYRIKNLLRQADVVSKAPIADISGSVTQTEQNDIVIVLSDIDSTNSISVIVDRLLSVFDQRIVIGGTEYMVETHAGISVLGDDGESAEALFQNACVACSDAQMNDVRNAYRFYSPQMDEAAKRHIRLQTDLHHAIEKGELELFYQPKMDLMSGDLVGFEALLRWHHAQLGLVSPNEFIPIAEKTGLIHQLNPWVMIEVIDQIKLWRLSGHRVDSVSVNVSALELKDPDFSAKVLRILKDADMPASSLEIEITESIGIEELDVARNNLEQLDGAGLPISIDDFGTGYSSLGYLQHFPISRLKIDRIFVNRCTEDEKNARVVRSIIIMGNSLGMRVLAEGVETQEQLMFLRDNHCDEIQGFLVSKPADAAQTTAHLEQPGQFSQVVLGATMDSNVVKETVVNLPLSGLNAVLARFPEAANDSEEIEPSSDQAAGLAD